MIELPVSIEGDKVGNPITVCGGSVDKISYNILCIYQLSFSLSCSVANTYMILQVKMVVIVGAFVIVAVGGRAWRKRRKKRLI